MTKTSTLLVLVLLLSSMLYGQVDNVSVGASYSQQAYYKISTGEVTTVPNDAWDIAFSNAGESDAGVFINESSTFNAFPLQVFVSETNDWSESINDTSPYVDSVIIYNEEKNWTEGAFNSIRDFNDPDDYGWGIYDEGENIIQGDRIFVIRKRNGVYIKFQIMTYTDGEYTFRYANLDGSEETTAIASKNEAGDVPLLHFSFETDAAVVIPTDYDLIFQRYAAALPVEEDVVQYVVVGALLAPGTQGAIATDINWSDVDIDDAGSFSYVPNTIGHEWKYFDLNSGWSVILDRAQWVRTRDGETYMIIFYNFSGASSGTTTLEKFNVTATSTTDQDIELDIILYPNPSSTHIVIGSIKSQFLNINITDISGTVVKNIRSFTNESISISDLPKGLYTVNIEYQSSETSKLIVVK